MITKDELAAMIATLESQPHLSLKEERYLAVMKELEEAWKELVDMAVAYEGLAKDGFYWGRTADGWRAEALLQKQLVENLRDKVK